MARNLFRTFSFLIILFSVTLSGRAEAQQQAWLQIEAQPTLREARDKIATYSEDLDGLAGFRLRSGWYAVVTGPYESLQAANAARLELRRRNVVPFDSFATDGRNFERRFWPVGADGAGTELTLQSTEAPGSAAGDPATTSRPAQQDAAAEQPPEETRAEARRSEAQLTRAERERIQIALRWFGHYEMRIDAAFGGGTRAAMAEWQRARDHEPTGILTTRQRAELLKSYEEERAALGLRTVRDQSAGVEIELPMAMVEFDRYEPPFAHYTSSDDSGVQVLLISREGNRSTLFGLYEIMQTLKIVPLEGERERRGDSFVLTGQDETRRSHTFARLQNGQVKGYTLVWTPEQDERMERVLDAMETSFSAFGGTLDDVQGQASLTPRDDLLAGLQVRRPELSRTGFFINDSGTVLTTTEVLAQCDRITLDSGFGADAVLRDETLGIAVLRPDERLAPMGYARFATQTPQRDDEVIVAGYSYADALPRPILSYGTFARAQTLDGDSTLAQLSVSVRPADAGGAVLNTRGDVIGMLQPRSREDGRVLPGGVGYAAQGAAIVEALDANGVAAERATSGGDALSRAALDDLAADMSVLVSCWR